MNQLQRLDAWPTWRKLLATALLIAALITGVLVSDPEAFLLFLTLGLVTCALAGYWRNLGNDGYSGIPGAGQQDRAITSSMGPIYDRTHEHLGTTDSLIIRARRR